MEPGVPAAVTWGKQVKARGWPEARIFEATGRPLNPENSPAEPFEGEPFQALLKGRASIEKVEPDVLRYAMPIQVVDKSCLACHVRNREGELLGGVGPDHSLRRWAPPHPGLLIAAAADGLLAKAACSMLLVR